MDCQLLDIVNYFIIDVDVFASLTAHILECPEHEPCPCASEQLYFANGNGLCEMTRFLSGSMTKSLFRFVSFVRVSPNCPLRENKLHIF